MDNFTQLVTNEFSPVLLLALYHMEDNVYQGQEFYVESHDVDSKGRVLAGKPMSAETMDAVLRSFESAKSKSLRTAGVIPKGMIYADVENEKFVWVFEPKVRALFFAKKLKIPNGDAWMPRLIFEAKQKSLSVYAVKQYKGGDTQLYRAPFHNVSTGNVCIGSAKTERKGNDFTSIIDYWERIFFASEFTHINGANPIKGDLNKMWKELIKTKQKFDNGQLVPLKNKSSNIKLSDILR